jgi:hypothetical protein
MWMFSELATDKSQNSPKQTSLMPGINLKDKTRTIESQLISGNKEKRFYHIHQKDWQKY